MAERKDERGLFGLSARMEARITKTIGLVATLGGLCGLIIPDSGPRRLALASIAAAVLLLSLVSICLRKRPKLYNPTKTEFVYKTRERAMAFAGVMLLITLAGVIIYLETSFKSPPPDKLAIAITAFTPESPALADTALQISKKLNRMLADCTNKDPNLRLKSEPFAQQLSQSGDASRDEACAIRFGKLHGAHLVIWGQVVRVGGHLQVRPKISTAYDWTAETEPDAREAARIKEDMIAQIFRPTDEQGLDRQIEALTNLLVRDARLLAKNWAQAIYALAGQSDETTLLLLGDTYLKQARDQKADDPRTSLDSAVETFDKLIDKLNKDPDDSAWVSAVAQFLLGEACRERASFDQTDGYLGRAKDAYGQSERAYSKIGADKTPWQLENNLGLVLFKLAALGDGAMEYLRRANDVYSVGLGILGENPDGTIPAGGCGVSQAGSPGEDEHVRNVAQVFGNRGSARFELGLQMRSSNGSVRDYLECARSDFETALGLLSSLAGRDRGSEAEIEGNLGNAYAELAEEKPDEADKLLEKAVKSYDHALDAFTPGDLRYTRVQKARAQTYYDQGIRSGQEVPLNRAVFEYVEVIRELRRTGMDEDLADALYIQAKAKRSLFHIHGCDLSCLQAAIVALQQSESLFGKLGNLQQAQQVHEELVKAQGEASRGANATGRASHQ